MESQALKIDDQEIRFTCNTCGLSFAAAEYQRDHMKTDWHRYNLKRRVAGLPPVPADAFAEKMMQQKSTVLEPKTRGSGNRQVTKKDLKRMEQQRRREAMAAMTTDEGSQAPSRADSLASAMSGVSLGEPSNFKSDSDSENENENDSDSDSDSGTAKNTAKNAENIPEDVEKMLQDKLAKMVKIPSHVCFMDMHESESVDENVVYMEKTYGLILPEPDFISDLNGLIEYINEKVGLGNCCLYCSYMGRSVEAARNHMAAKRHIRIPYDSEANKAELQDFYDFTKSYGASSAGNDWEDVSDDDLETGETHVLADGEEFLEDENLYVNGYELQIGGKTAGHRSLQRYYKQRYVEPKESAGRKAVKMIDFRSPGVDEKQAAKLIKDSRKEAKRQEKFQFTRVKNQNFQKHYRDELLQ